SPDFVANYLRYGYVKPRLGRSWLSSFTFPAACWNAFKDGRSLRGDVYFWPGAGDRRAAAADDEAVRATGHHVARAVNQQLVSEGTTATAPCDWARACDFTRHAPS